MGHQKRDYVKKKWKWETRTSIIGVCCLQRAVVDTIHRCHNLERGCTINCDSILWLKNKSREGRAQFYLLTAFTWYRVKKDLSFKSEKNVSHKMLPLSILKWMLINSCVFRIIKFVCFHEYTKLYNLVYQSNVLSYFYW